MHHVNCECLKKNTKPQADASVLQSMGVVCLHASLRVLIRCLTSSRCLGDVEIFPICVQGKCRKEAKNRREIKRKAMGKRKTARDISLGLAGLSMLLMVH